ncbi:MAG: hypothetical protein NVSMB38_00690 [Ktedonobacteraceae bacterium]
MAGQWDDTLKKIIGISTEDFVHWLFREAIYEGEVDRELPLRTIHADYLLAIKLNGIRCLLHIEFQRTPDPDMAERLLEYNVQATRNDKEHRPVSSYVIYLKPHENMPTSPLVKRFPNGEEIWHFNFKNIKPWEYTAEDILQESLPGLLLFLPLTKDGTKRDTIEEMITGLVSAGKEEALSLAYIIAALVFEKQDDLQWLKERFAMLEEIFQDSWAYQDIFQKGTLQGRRQAVLDVIKARFPTVDMLVQEQIDNIVDLEVLQDLLIKVSTLEQDIEIVQAVFMAVKANSKR